MKSVQEHGEVVEAYVQGEREAVGAIRAEPVP